MGIFLTLLCSCSSLNSGYNTNNSPPTLTADQYLAMANNSQGDIQQDYLFKAANRSLNEQHFTKSQSIINQIIPSTPPMQVSKQLIQAKLYLKTKQLNAANTLLNTISSGNILLSQPDQITLLKLQAILAEAQGNIIDSINKRDQLYPLLDADTDQQHQNTIAIWLSLQKITTDQLTEKNQLTPASTLKGWISLALVTRQSQSPQQLVTNIMQWRQQNSSHPANELLPQNLQSRLKATVLPQNIALLLPMTGQLQHAASAIRNGFFAAYYYRKSHSNYAPNIQVYDTTNSNIINLYQKAIQQGANFIVGPLTKDNILQLASNPIAVPTLVLNTPPTLSTAVKNLYTFGLSPLDEAQQVVQKAKSNGLQRALIITPNNEWGQFIAEAFKTKWLTLGGEEVAQLAFSNQTQLAMQVRHTLNIDQSDLRYRSLKKILNKKIRFIPRRRQDIDSIFLAAQPLFARQIKPLLNFYYAGAIPVYAISPIYTGHPNRQNDHDLNGITFCDIPWVLQTKTLTPTSLITIKNNIKAIWKNSYNSNKKLYALGVDAYNIIPKLNQMTLLPQFGIRAATGILYLDTSNHIYRQLPWARFKNGRPVLVQE